MINMNYVDTVHEIYNFEWDNYERTPNIKVTKYGKSVIFPKSYLDIANIIEGLNDYFLKNEDEFIYLMTYNNPAIWCKYVKEKLKINFASIVAAYFTIYKFGSIK